MSEQVKPAPRAYQANVFWDQQDCATLSAQVYLASDADSYIDALHAEAEALRAEIEELDALRNRQSDLLSQTAIAVRGPEPALTRYSHADIPSRVKTVVAELEAARGLLREVRQRCQLPDWARSQIDKLTATPAPEVQAEQGERQEAVAWRLHLPDGRTTLEKGYPKWAEGEGDGYAIQPLYTTPQPGPDVRALVEALEQIQRWDGFPSTGKTWEGSGEQVSFSVCYGSNGERDFMRNVAAQALAPYRQAQRKGESHDT